MNEQPYGFEYNGKPVAAATYGSNYIPELCRVLDTHGSSRIRTILEWGSGLTTQVFADYGERKWGTELFVTIDENKDYQNQIFAGRQRPEFLVTKCLPQMGPSKSQKDQGVNYSTYPLTLGEKFDLIFIDGRRRMECAFMAAIMSHADTVVIIHDYRRTRYQPVLALFTSIEDGPQFRVMRPRPDVLNAIAPGRENIQGYMHCLQFNNIPPE